MHQNIYHYHSDFKLESGVTLGNYQLTYTTYGQLNAAKDNVVWVFHALTANSRPDEWWPGLIGDGKLFDPSRHYIVCANMPGSCYGSTGPLEIDGKTGERFYHDFPFFTTRDMIRAYEPLREHLGIEKIKIGIGGSMGGQQLLEWAIEKPDLFEYLLPIATNARHSAWGIAFNASQRMCIEVDPTWRERHEQAGIAGMKAARSVALLSYRHYSTYHLSQTEEHANRLTNYKSESYQRYQGEKLAKRFNAFSYYFLSKSMDAHDVSRNRDSLEEALGRIRAKTLSIGITSDILFPPTEQKFIADHIPGAHFREIDSLYGHDGFLLEFDQIEGLLRGFLREEI